MSLDIPTVVLSWPGWVILPIGLLLKHNCGFQEKYPTKWWHFGLLFNLAKLFISTQISSLEIWFIVDFFFQNWFDVNVLDFQLPFNVDYFDIFWFGHCFGDLFKNGAKVFLQSFGHTDFLDFWRHKHWVHILTYDDLVSLQTCKLIFGTIWMVLGAYLPYVLHWWVDTAVWICLGGLE